MTASSLTASSSRPAADDLGVAAQLHRRCDPWVKHFRDDLEHDRRQLAEVPEETPFICIARRCGTDLLILRPASDPHFPPMGQRVPFLFGEADREKLADAVLTVLNFNQAEHEQEERRWFAHWGEGVVWSVEPEEALRKAQAWRDRLGRAWDRERRLARR